MAGREGGVGAPAAHLLPATACQVIMLLTYYLLLPATACQVIVLRHLDVTAKVEAADDSMSLAQLTEATLALLDLIFPRHIIEYMTMDAADNANVNAVLHQDPAAAAAAEAAQVTRPEQKEPPTATSLCLKTLQGRDYRHLTTRHDQVRAGWARDTGVDACMHACVGARVGGMQGGGGSSVLLANVLATAFKRPS